MKKVNSPKKVTSKKIVVKKKSSAKESKPTASNYVIILKLADNTFEAKGKDFMEAMQGLKGEVNVVLKSKGEFMLQSENKKSTVMLKPFQIRKLLLDKTMQEIFQKRMINALK